MSIWGKRPYGSNEEILSLISDRWDVQQQLTKMGWDKEFLLQWQSLDFKCEFSHWLNDEFSCNATYEINSQRLIYALGRLNEQERSSMEAQVLGDLTTIREHCEYAEAPRRL